MSPASEYRLSQIPPSHADNDQITRGKEGDIVGPILSRLSWDLSYQRNTELCSREPAWLIHFRYFITCNVLQTFQMLSVYFWFRHLFLSTKYQTFVYLLNRWLLGNWHGLRWVAHVCRVLVVGWAALCWHRHRGCHWTTLDVCCTHWLLAWANICVNTYILVRLVCFSQIQYLQTFT